MTSADPNHLQKALLPNIITLSVGLGITQTFVYEEQESQWC